MIGLFLATHYGRQSSDALLMQWYCSWYIHIQYIYIYIFMLDNWIFVLQSLAICLDHPGQNELMNFYCRQNEKLSRQSFVAIHIVSWPGLTGPEIWSGHRMKDAWSPLFSSHRRGTMIHEIIDNRQLDCLFNSLFGLTARKTVKLCITGLFAVFETSGFPQKMASDPESVFMPWRHHFQHLVVEGS